MTSAQKRDGISASNYGAGAGSQDNNLEVMLAS
eukprot:CAMPEP_0171842550 /NCGR_PEP_ID=MMETSP0992-20121227/15272_1 /TAXON_ID=483369 /ORGANISM="non described non described, Strain CCMP2098" /LENGTH=32 /DNA_ID= /DNA_START= /DNA_END= /DNA_ORIENTATION=